MTKAQLAERVSRPSGCPAPHTPFLIPLPSHCCRSYGAAVHVRSALFRFVGIAFATFRMHECVRLVHHRLRPLQEREIKDYRASHELPATDLDSVLLEERLNSLSIHRRAVAQA